MKKVVIIGAGPAGLTAGFELLKKSKDYQIIILEESDTVGGISRTVQYNGNRMDIGGHRFFSKDSEVTKWWNNILPLQGAPSFDDLKTGRSFELNPNGPNPEKEDKVMLKRRRISRIYYKRKFFDYPVKMNLKTILNMGLFTTAKAGFSYIFAIIRKLPETSLENFYINRFGRKLYSMFFEGYTEKLWGRHPRDISADWGSQRVKGLSIVAILKDIFGKLLFLKPKQVETSLIEEFSYPKFGPGQLWETAAAQFESMGGKIIKNAKAAKFKTKKNKFEEVLYIKNDKEYSLPADIVISSMPLKDLAAGLDNIPNKIERIAKGLPYRDFVTVGLLLKKLNLKNKTEIKTINNIVPDCWIYVQDSGVKLGRIQIFNNWSPYLVAKPEETVWIGLEYFCNENDKYWNMSSQEWRTLGIEELLKMGVISDAADVLDSHLERVKKAYPAYFDTYKDIGKLVDYLDTFDNLYCVGRNGQHRYNNMDHSMATSFAAVRNILGEMSDKKAIWQINTEKSYHESKKI
ncbi:MAG: NAD(P)/FAD-dependent oxidoreductase [Alphaproteobacteria bacterium]|nr:NAD(P)/FAD-dependent oxidoreductase [Alphaproteobacteria bacterium]